jgi:hypothetical protein
MLLKDLLAQINQEVKANPKVLGFEVRIDQYHDGIYISKDGTVEADIFRVEPAICRGETSTVTIG